MEVATITAEEVLRIHEILVADFARSNDPIAPAGVRDLGILQSAVGRQLSGSKSLLKYATPIGNAATLLYGICNDHPFHNGNKRTALVSMLVHLDRNGLTLKDTRQSDLFNLVLGVAAHTIVSSKGSRSGAKPQLRVSSDAEVDAVVAWIRQRAAKPHRGERQITYRELRRLLKGRGFELEPGNSRGNSAEIYRWVEERRLLRGPRRVRKRLGAIGYCDEGTFVSLRDIKLTRKICRLTEEEGVDSDAFYDQEAVVDSFINRYRSVLRRLSKR